MQNKPNTRVFFLQALNFPLSFITAIISSLNIFFFQLLLTVQCKFPRHEAIRFFSFKFRFPVDFLEDLLVYPIYCRAIYTVRLSNLTCALLLETAVVSFKVFVRIFVFPRNCPFSPDYYEYGSSFLWLVFYVPTFPPTL